MTALCTFAAVAPIFDDETRMGEAVEVCGRCRVLDDCQARVLDDESRGIRHIGVAGGLLPDNRPAPYRDPNYVPPKPVSKTAPAPCGTLTARRRHRRRGEQCVVCEEAQQRLLFPCGTRAAARRHERYGEPVCDACAQARCAYNAQRRAKRAAARLTAPVDQVAVARTLTGERLPLRIAERVEVARNVRDNGGTRYKLTKVLGTSTATASRLLRLAAETEEQTGVA